MAYTKNLWTFVNSRICTQFILPAITLKAKKLALRPYITSGKVTGSNPNEVADIFNLPNLSNCITAFASTQTLAEMRG
jgi:hypothetical protein